MKKFFAMAAIALFMMTSCSDDDNTPETTTINPTEDITLLKKVIATSENGTVTTTNYTYNGNKIISQISSNGTSSVFTYTGNLITHVETIKNNILTYETTVEYNSSNQKTSQVSLSIYPNFVMGTKEVYTYNENGTITVKQYSGNAESQTVYGATDTITIEENSIFHNWMDSDLYTHTFDSKNNPMKNILGFKEYQGPHFDGDHNFLTAYTRPAGSDYINTYTYNSNDYPVTSIEKVYDFNNQLYVVAQKQFFYE